jgi:hypothetical protein
VRGSFSCACGGRGASMLSFSVCRSGESRDRGVSVLFGAPAARVVVSSLTWVPSASRWPGHFSLLVQREVTKRKDAPLTRLPGLLPSRSACGLWGLSTALVPLRSPASRPKPGLRHPWLRRSSGRSSASACPPRPCADDRLAHIVCATPSGPSHRPPAAPEGTRRATRPPGRAKIGLRRHGALL